MSENNSRKYVSFAAIDPYLESNIVLPTEKESSKDFVNWGEGNGYPDYLLSLFNNVTTLRAIVNGNVDFIVGDDITIMPLNDKFSGGVMNRAGETITDIVKNIARDYNIYGGFALQVIRDYAGDVAEVYYLDMRFVRSNKENTVFYYNEKWGKVGKKKTIVYPCFLPTEIVKGLPEEDRKKHASSILFVKNMHTQVYPAPLYAASVKACEIERMVDEYHLNSIENGFSSSVCVNFNNGDPGEQQKKEIEEDFTDKFSGHQNAGRIMFSWNKDRTAATTLTEFKVEDFGEKYKALSSHSRMQIFSAFRAQPLLFGLNQDVATGFSTDEFEQSFKLYNRTQVRPVQRLIADAFDKIYGQKGVISIKPFSLDGLTETEVD